MKFGLGGYQEEELKKQKDIRLLARFVPLLTKNITMIVFSILLMVLLSLLDIVVPFVTRMVVDDYIMPSMADPDKSRYLMGAFWGGIALFGVALARLIFSFIQIMVMEYAGQRMMHELRIKVFSHIQALPVSFFTKNTVGRLATRVTNDIQNMQEMFTTVITFVMKDLFTLTGIIIIVVAMDVKLSLALFFVIPLVIFSTWFFSRYSRAVFRRLRANIAEINSMFSESTGGIRVIQLFSRQKQMMEQFKEINHENYLAGVSQVKIFGLFMPVIDLLSSFALAIVIFYGGGRAVSEALSLGTLVAFISYTKMFFRPVRDLSEKHNVLQNALSSGERITQILDKKVDETGGELALDGLKSLEFKHVGFAYTPGEDILKDISFELNAGESLAILGPTGSGKTSLINLIVKFYPRNRGEIRINGKDIDDYTTWALRNKIALVTQDPYLFSGTIRDNIVPPGTIMDTATLDAILERSHVRSLIDHMPKGLDTVLSQGGSSLSSGERQLISIARAFAREPHLIIFDEATSYVDTESEEKIRLATEKLKENRTSITIAHRLRSAMTADRIMVLKDGEIIEYGDHGTLMAEKGFYYHFQTLDKD
ncbi:ATP-binding cassette, subfamily B [Desulfocicer vacuolatum DSM 3385]|uniref:ATP-binding cassette, subfamily B n=1 Tax=Desulfocicer vacuolatum DSM 3385 TaxID=1121400 RepID=A0A1W2AEX9_9BACT|nr:ABC transporter ATP-binding protein [Desulfocicer vacuolatum]SMC59279.1 ATP-binding cassette, subfamily B [Desulfocicer vacuolatum DSM 3385]